MPPILRSLSHLSTKAEARDWTSRNTGTLHPLQSACSHGVELDVSSDLKPRVANALAGKRI